MSATTSEDCLFCRIVSGEVPADVVAETEQSLAFRDIEPAAPTHVLVVPRRHVPDLAGLADGIRRRARRRRAAGRAGGRATRACPATASSPTPGRRPSRASSTPTCTCIGGRTLSWPPG